MAIQALIRFILPREDHWYDMLEELARLTHAASTALASFKELPADKVQESVQAIEHKADDVVRRMEDALARTFVTPLDREDLHRLTAELDDIVDLMNLAARAFSLYHLERPTPPMVQLMDKLISCTALIAEEVPRLRKHEYQLLIDGGRKVRVIEKEADAIYRQAISDLFSASHPDFRELLRQKEALDDLEAAVDYCDNVADLLANLAVKHG
jgi:predicted phosphate transport protein (TIGR00153 family)